MFDSKECEWADLTLFLDGVKVTKVTRVKYKKSHEKEALYAAGSEPFSIQRGNKSYTGEIALLKGAVDALNKAAVAAGGDDLTDVSFTVGVVYKAKGTRVLQTDTLSGWEFTEYEKGMEQNAKKMEVTLPGLFLALKSI
jgi:hypothetical protein